MGEQHLDALAIAARSFEGFGLGQPARHITGLLVNAARDSAYRRLRTALRFEGTVAAIACPGPIVDCLSISGDLAGGTQNFAGRADVDVVLLIEGEVFAAERSILALGVVIDRDVRRDLGLVDQPIEVGTRTVGRIAGEPFGLDGEALFGALEHGLGRANLGLADGAGCLDIHDDADLHVDEIVVRITEEGRSPQGACPLRRRIGWRNELWSDLACRPERRVIERGKILLRRPARRSRIDRPVPPCPAHRPLLVGVGYDEARVNCEPFSTDQPSCNAAFDNTLENLAKHVALNKPLMTSAREDRVIWDFVLN